MITIQILLQLENMYLLKCFRKKGTIQRLCMFSEQKYLKDTMRRLELGGQSEYGRTNQSVIMLILLSKEPPMVPCVSETQNFCPSVLTTNRISNCVTAQTPVSMCMGRQMQENMFQVCVPKTWVYSCPCQLEFWFQNSLFHLVQINKPIVKFYC